MKLAKVLNKHPVIGIVGNRSEAKTSLALCKLKELRKDYKEVQIAVFGVEPSLYNVLHQLNIKILHSKQDILDLNLRDTVIYISEMAMFFDTHTRSKQLNRLMKFFDRIEHNNCKLIMDTAREGYFNKFMCSRVTCFLVKKIEYDALVRGTWLNEHVKGIYNTSEYRLDITKDRYYVIASDQESKQFTFGYDSDFDSKKDNKKLF